MWHSHGFNGGYCGGGIPQSPQAVNLQFGLESPVMTAFAVFPSPGPGERLHFICDESKVGGNGSEPGRES